MGQGLCKGPGSRPAHFLLFLGAFLSHKTEKVFCVPQGADQLPPFCSVSHSSPGSVPSELSCLGSLPTLACLAESWNTGLVAPWGLGYPLWVLEQGSTLLSGLLFLTEA